MVLLVNGIIVIAMLGLLGVLVRSRSLDRRNPDRVKPLPDYWPRTWTRNPLTLWLSRSPGRLLGYILGLEVVALVVGIVLLLRHDSFGGVLIAASVLGLALNADPLRRAARAVKDQKLN